MEGTEPKGTKLEEAKEIRSVSDMMRTLQAEAEAVKNGTLAESTANVVQKFRKLQLQCASLNLQFLRMFKGGQAPAGELLLLPSVNGHGEKAKAKQARAASA